MLILFYTDSDGDYIFGCTKQKGYTKLSRQPVIFINVLQEDDIVWQAWNFFLSKAG